MEEWMALIDYSKPTGTEEKEQYHIRCRKGDIGSVVLVPGDQERVTRVAEHLSDAGKVAENRGMITYTGTYNGVSVSVTSTGMGGPSAAIAYEELINVGAKVLVRVGSVAALQPDIEPGDLSLPFGCIRDDGASDYYVPPNYPAVPDPLLYAALVRRAQQSGVRFWQGINWTHSAFYARSKGYFLQWAGKRVVTLEMEAATLMTIATLRGVAAAFIGTVFENRIRQATREEMDLSVPSHTLPAVGAGVEASIRIALDASTDYYKTIHTKEEVRL